MELSQTTLSLIDDKLLGTVTDGFHKAIHRSFEVDNGSHTHAEVKRRFDICVRIFEQLRGDLDWGVHRIVDYLPKYLRAELDGIPWEPDTRSVWIPQDGA